MGYVFGIKVSICHTRQLHLWTHLEFYMCLHVVFFFFTFSKSSQLVTVSLSIGQHRSVADSSKIMLSPKHSSSPFLPTTLRNRIRGPWSPAIPARVRNDPLSITTGFGTSRFTAWVFVCAHALCVIKRGHGKEGRYIT